MMINSSNNNDGRDLPIFDNHYSNATLLENWREDRCQTINTRHVSSEGIEETTKIKIPFTLSDASVADNAKACKQWAQTHSTYEDTFKANILINGHAAPMTRITNVDKALLLGSRNADSERFEGEPTSKTYGAHHINNKEKKEATNKTKGKCCNDPTNDKDELSYKYNTNKAENLYESLKISKPSNQIFDNNAIKNKKAKEANYIDRQLLNTSRSNYQTTKQLTDTIVEHYQFQRRLPPIDV